MLLSLENFHVRFMINKQTNCVFFLQLGFGSWLTIVPAFKAFSSFGVSVEVQARGKYKHKYIGNIEKLCKYKI